MKKLIIFLITALCFNVINMHYVKAAETYSFYEGEYIPGIWINKVKDGLIHYEQVRFLRQSGTNQFSYCLEPFVPLNVNGVYTKDLTADNLSPSQMKRISLIAYFGYQYGNHTDSKWYAISQYMIWKEADPNHDIYFTDRLNGNRTNIYDGEIAEINNLISNYLTTPSIANAHVDLVEEHSVTLIDNNNVLSNYTSDNPNAIINGNKLIISNLTEGDYKINLTRKNKRTATIPFFYNSPNSQNMSIVGDLDDINVSLNISVRNTTVELTKVDKDTQDIVPSGEGVLTGAVYQIYDKDMKPLTKLTIDENMKATLKNLDYGEYYIQEIEAGLGYKLDENIYSFTIDKDHLDITLTLENEIIKKKIEIHKNYGDGSISNSEEGITFDIYDHKNKLYTSITTDSNGYASIYLPYGRYTIKQRNTTPGYAYNDDISINVTDEESITYNLYDYKIKVPNTHKNNHSNGLIWTILIISGVYVKKRSFC